jgi:hypothetical protein
VAGQSRANTSKECSLSDGKPTTDPDRLGAMRAVEGKVARLRATQRLRRKYCSALALRPACELLLTAFKVHEMGLIVK